MINTPANRTIECMEVSFRKPNRSGASEYLTCCCPQPTSDGYGNVLCGHTVPRNATIRCSAFDSGIVLRTPAWRCSGPPLRVWTGRRFEGGRKSDRQDPGRDESADPATTRPSDVGSVVGVSALLSPSWKARTLHASRSSGEWTIAARETTPELSGRRYPERRPRPTVPECAFPVPRSSRRAPLETLPGSRLYPGQWI